MESQKQWDWAAIDAEWDRGRKLRSLDDVELPDVVRVGKGHTVSGAAIATVLRAIDNLGRGAAVQATRAELSRVTRLSPATVGRALAGLELLRLVVKRETIVPGRGQAANTLQIVWPNLEEPIGDAAELGENRVRMVRGAGAHDARGGCASCADRVRMVRGAGAHGAHPNNKDPRIGACGASKDLEMVSKNSNLKTKTSAPGVWPKTIEAAELVDPDRLDELCDLATAEGWVAATPLGRLRFFTLAAYCVRQVREGRANSSPALLTSNARAGRWFGDHGDETRAREAIRQTDGEDVTPRQPAAEPVDDGTERQRQLAALAALGARR